MTKTFRDENGDEWISISNVSSWDTLAIKRKEPKKSELDKEAANIKCEHERMGYIKGFKRAIEVAEYWLVNPSHSFVIEKLKEYAGINE